MTFINKIEICSRTLIMEIQWLFIYVAPNFTLEPSS